MKRIRTFFTSINTSTAKVFFGLSALGLAASLVSTESDASAAVTRKRFKKTPPTSLAARFAHIPKAVAASPDPVNMVKLKASVSATSGCGAMEVAPGVIVRLDCQQYTKVSKSIAHLSIAKSAMLKARTGGSKLVPRPAPSGSAKPSQDVKAQGAPGDDGKTTAEEEFPETVDHRALGLEGPIKDQGAVGACTAFALSTTMDNALRRAGREDTISPTHVWSGYGTPNMQDAGDANFGRPVATFDTWSYSAREACKLARSSWEECSSYLDVQKNSWSTDKDLMAKLNKADQAGKAKISAIEALTPQPADMNELLEVLSSGADVWAAFRIDGSAWRNSAMKNAVIPDWTTPMGGHAVTISGYRTTPSGKQFLIHNSWGVKWGEGGYAWISEAMVSKWLTQAYRIKLEGDDVKPIEVTDDDCAGDELVDSETKKCAKICPDDSRPVGGRCSKK
jgi:C1A family cysteine protease